MHKSCGRKTSWSGKACLKVNTFLQVSKQQFRMGSPSRWGRLVVGRMADHMAWQASWPETSWPWL